MSDDKLQDRINRGKAAELLLQNELFREAFDALRQDATQRLMNTLPSQTEDREQFYLAVKNLDAVERIVRQYVGDGKIALQELDYLSKPATHLRAV